MMHICLGKVALNNKGNSISGKKKMMVLNLIIHMIYYSFRCLYSYMHHDEVLNFIKHMLYYSVRCLNTLEFKNLYSFMTIETKLLRILWSAYRLRSSFDKTKTRCERYCNLFGCGYRRIRIHNSSIPENTILLLRAILNASHKADMFFS